MAKARYYKSDGKKGRARSLPSSLFDGDVNNSVLHAVVKAHLGNQRQGTAVAKNRSAVSGGARKPWRQKGTGRARQGTTRAPQWVGGGRAFPPQSHSWRQRVPKKVKALARQSAFTARAREDRVILVDALDFDSPGTRRLVKYLASIEAPGKVLLLTDGLSDNVVLSARNVPEILVRPFGEESTYDILWATTVVIERAAVDALETPDDSEVDAQDSDATESEAAVEVKDGSGAEIEAETTGEATATADAATEIEDDGEEETDA